MVGTPEVEILALMQVAAIEVCDASNKYSLQMEETVRCISLRLPSERHVHKYTSLLSVERELTRWYLQRNHYVFFLTKISERPVRNLFPHWDSIEFGKYGSFRRWPKFKTHEVSKEFVVIA